MQTERHARLTLFAALSVALAMGTGTPVAAQVPAAPSVLDDSVLPGANFDKAQFRLWLPNSAGALRGALVLVPGSNGDGRSMAEDTVWQAFAARNRLAIIACRFTDKPHDQGFIEDYVNVSKGSGQALLDVLDRFAGRAHHPELANAPLLFWGMSAGGQLDYEFAAWQPERVIAFVVNKGGIYYTALTSRATRAVPALLFIGGKDLESRINTITGLFALNRRGGALWALTEEPDAAHVIGRSRDLAIEFFDDVLPLRLDAGSGALKPLDEKAGFVGDYHTKTITPMGATKLPSYPTSWLPTERVARAWLSVITDQPFP